MKAVASRFGLQLPPQANPGLKNAAVVLVTAELPAFAKPGQRLDITVASMGKAKSLRGGSADPDPAAGRGRPGLCDGAGQSGGRGPRRGWRRRVEDRRQHSVSRAHSGWAPRSSVRSTTGFAIRRPSLTLQPGAQPTSPRRRTSRSAINAQVGHRRRRVAVDGVTDRNPRATPGFADVRATLMSPDREPGRRDRRAARQSHRQRAHRHRRHQLRSAGGPRCGHARQADRTDRRAAAESANPNHSARARPRWNAASPM
jgi:flagellar P-ring protein FlgI